MKFLKNRVLPFVCVFSICLSLCIVPSYALPFPDGFKDSDSVDAINYELNNGYFAEGIETIAWALGLDNVVESVFWHYVDSKMYNKIGEVGVDDLNRYCATFNTAFNMTAGENFFSHAQNMSEEIKNYVLCYIFFGVPGMQFEVREHPSSGLYRIYEPTLEWWVTDSIGRYPYLTPNVDSSGGNTWVGEVTAADRVSSGSVKLEDEGRLNAICNQIRASGIPAQIKSLGSNHKCIWYNRQVLCDEIGQPIVCWFNADQSATSQDRQDTIVMEDGTIVEGDLTDNSTNIDLENMLITLPNGSINFIDQLIYDESTKSYHIDSHDTYNYTVNNYYTWNYYINYTSITYIGQTEEYNKYYEVYYELPDGRDSADLTREELEQLNLSIDVIPYGRSADDTSLRSLYHFDGDTRDSSYWNYCTDFTWDYGASLTYMDAGVFDGALYLDEGRHEFTLTLPSNVLSDDFTLQFRYYQSATAAPQCDTSVRFGNATVLKMNGNAFCDPYNAEKIKTPIGTWNEVALIRSNGTIYYYLNGVLFHSWANSNGFTNTVRFVFGDTQQTFKYLDEFRFLNFALVEDGASYEPTSVPHDTNLTLVLPDSAVPVADEYWSLTSSGENLLGVTLDDFSSNTIPSWWNNTNTTGKEWFPYWLPTDYPMTHTTARGTLTAFSGFLRLTNNSGRVSWDTYYGCYAPFQTGFAGNRNVLKSYGSYVFSIVLADGTVHSAPFTYKSNVDVDVVCDWGSFGYMYGDKDYQYLYVCPTSGSYVDIMYMELVEGTSTDLTAEWVESVTAIDRDDLNTPTLAVRTDIDITSYQIGGVRPSVPEKGMVWALVENERIVSIQIYNGQAWEGVDGRIWTGQRWIPASSYNIVTLQDMYDIVDATPDFEYIYTESGFWTWWQKSWNAFTDKLFDTLGSGGSGGSSSIVPGDVQQSASSALSSLIEGIFGVIIEVLKSLIGAAQDLLSGIFSFFSDTVFGGIKDFFSSFDELINPFKSTVENEDGSTTTTTGLSDDVVTGLGFFSGLIMLIPDEIRVILFFFFGLTMFLAVLKRFA